MKVLESLRQPSTLSVLVSGAGSTTDFVFILRGEAITRLSKRQPAVADSTIEAEYISTAQAVKEALWLRVLLRDHQAGHRGQHVPDQG